MRKTLLLLLFLSEASALLADAYLRFEENGKIGIKDEAGAVVLPASFDALGWSDGSFSVTNEITGYRKNERWGLVNLRKQFITPAVFQSLTTSGGDRVVASRAISPFVVKFGCLDLSGRVVIPFEYDAITLHDLRAVVMKKREIRYEFGLIDLDNRQILPVQYKKITPIGSLRYAIENFSSKLALCSEEGSWVTDFVIDSLSSFRHDLSILYNNQTRGVIDRNGKIILPADYRDVKISDDGQVLARKPDEWKILGTNFKERANVKCDSISFLPNGWAITALDGKYGLVDDSLKAEWPVEYQRITLAGENKVLTKKDNRFRLSRLDRSHVFDMAFDSLCVDKNFVRALQGGRWALYDTFGIKKSAWYERLEPFNGKFFPSQNRGHWGGVDRYGKEIIACVYDSITEIKDELCAVSFMGEYGIINLEDHWLLSPRKHPLMLVSTEYYIEKQDSLIMLMDFAGNIIYFTDHEFEIREDYLVERLRNGMERNVSFQGLILEEKMPLLVSAEEVFRKSEGLIGIRRDDKFGFVDDRGRLRIANRYDGIGEFHEGLAPVKLLGKWGYINADEQIVIQPNFEMAGNFDRGLAKIYRKSKAGIINREGKTLVEPRYDDIDRLPSGHLMLTLNSLRGLADENGRILIEPRFEYLKVLDGNRVIVRQNNQYGVLTTDGMSLLSLQYDELTYLPVRNEFLAKKKSEWVEMKVGE